jgi:hypothetical protein
MQGLSAKTAEDSDQYGPGKRCKAPMPSFALVPRCMCQCCPQAVEERPFTHVLAEMVTVHRDLDPKHK